MDNQKSFDQFKKDINNLYKVGNLIFLSNNILDTAKIKSIKFDKFFNCATLYVIKKSGFGQSINFFNK